MICDIHQEFGLGGKVVATTTDNGANYIAAFKHFGVEDNDIPIKGEASEEESDPEVITLIGKPANVYDQLQEFEDEDNELPKHFRCGYVCHHF